MRGGRTGRIRGWGIGEGICLLMLWSRCTMMFQTSSLMMREGNMRSLKVGSVRNRCRARTRIFRFHIHNTHLNAHLNMYLRIPGHIKSSSMALSTYRVTIVNISSDLHQPLRVYQRLTDRPRSLYMELLPSQIWYSINGVSIGYAGYRFPGRGGCAGRSAGGSWGDELKSVKGRKKGRGKLQGKFKGRLKK